LGTDTQQLGKFGYRGSVTFKQLEVSNLVQTNALSKLLIEKGLITEAEYMEKLSAERAGFQGMLEKTRLET